MQLIFECKSDPDNARLIARLFTKLIRRRELKKISDGKEITTNELL